MHKLITFFAMSLLLVTAQALPADARSDELLPTQVFSTGDHDTGYGSVEIPVIYATDRPDIVSTDPNAEGGLAFGVATVIMPCTEAMMDHSKTKLKASLTALGWVQKRNAKVPDPKVSIVGWTPQPHDPPLIKLESLPHAVTLQTIKNEWLAAPDKEMTVYVHGYSCRFDSALYTCGYLSSCLEKPVICYSWNSLGRTRSKEYKLDEQTVSDRGVQEHFCGFLKQDLANMTGVFGSLSLVAHSLGNRLVAYSLNNCIYEGKNEISPFLEKLILIAPDIRKDKMREFFGERMARSGENVFIFHNPRDKAFVASRISDFINFQAPKDKVGRRIATLPGIRFINYSAVAEPNKLQLRSFKDLFQNAPIGHYLRFEYLNALLQSGTAPPDHFLFDNMTIIPGDGLGVPSVTARELKKCATMNAENARLRKELEDCQESHGN